MFDELDVMKNYTGQVLLLEEDYYLAPDIITTLQMTLNLKKKSVPPPPINRPGLSNNFITAL